MEDLADERKPIIDIPNDRYFPNIFWPIVVESPSTSKLSLATRLEIQRSAVNALHLMVTIGRFTEADYQGAVLEVSAAVCAKVYGAQDLLKRGDRNDIDGEASRVASNVIRRYLSESGGSLQRGRLHLGT